MTWTLIVARPAAKAVERSPRPDRVRLTRALQDLREDPFRGDVARLKGQPGDLRKRVGNWRIFFRLHDDARVIEVTAVTRRTTTTYRRR